MSISKPAFEPSILRPGDLITITYSREGWDRQPFRVVRIAPATNYRTAAITAQIHDDDWYAIAGGGSTGNGRLPGYQVGLPRPLLGTKTGQYRCIAIRHCRDLFGKLGWQRVHPTDGGLRQSREKHERRNFGSSSRSERAVVDHRRNAHGRSDFVLWRNRRRLFRGREWSFLSDKSSHPGRYKYESGDSPESQLFIESCQLQRVPGSNSCRSYYKSPRALPIAAQFIDTGAQVTLVAPPDINYDHANFYWRIELQPEETVDIHSSITIGNSTLQMLTNEYSGAVVRILHGTGAGQERTARGKFCHHHHHYIPVDG